MRFPILAKGLALCALAASPSFAQKHYDPGVTDSEIKIGQTAPLSGPVSANGNGAKAQITFFKMINDRGGVNGRKIDFILYDDGYNPARTVEQTRKLVEEDKVFVVFGSTGTPTNSLSANTLMHRKCRSSFSSPARRNLTIRRIFPGAFRAPSIT
jgi:branched-chain amino acid transport system substrate-binding protein